VKVPSSGARGGRAGRAAPPGDNSRSLSRYVYQTLLARLLRNELVPGEMLNRRDVARELGVSVAPVLEAMVQLENEGYLEGIPRKGTRVRPVRSEDVVGQLIVREALECAAARLYCGAVVRERLPELRAIAQRLDTFKTDSPQRWEREIAFHQALVRLTGCEALIREFERVYRLTVFHRINRVVGSQLGRVVNRHVKLLTRLASAGPDDAERAIREHVRSGKGDLFPT
jgi:GntR family transcriptional regulator, rspAB operon transcriptional repressor